MSNKLLIIGGGGHCKSCIDVVNMDGRFNIEGMLDDNKPLSTLIGEYSVVGDTFHLSIDYYAKENNFLIAIGDNAIRTKFFTQLFEAQQNLPTIISPKAIVSSSAIIGVGTIIMHNAIVNSEAIIKHNCIINTNAIIEHDVEIGNNCHIGPGAIIIGNIKICDNVFIGAGSVIIKDITEPGNYVGAPGVKI